MKLQIRPLTPDLWPALHRPNARQTHRRQAGTTGLEMLRTETFRGAEKDLAAALCEDTLTVPSA